jgi:glycosyltransferase involved in cell wall biosynthesis
VSVGVVVPVRGWAPYLAEALDSVLAEGPDEVVVVDNASEEPVALHPDHAARVRLVRRDGPVLGPAAARNLGVERLETELVAFCDADDAWEPGSLAPRLRWLEDADLVFGRARIVGPDGRETGERWATTEVGPFDDIAVLYSDNPIPTSSVVLRRSRFEPFDETLVNAEDWELWLRLLAGGARFACAFETVVRYRRHAGGISARLTELARAQRVLHERHAAAVPAEVRDRALAADRAGEAAGLVRDRDYAAARALMPPGARRAALAVPGLRALAGRRDPYRR